jgi:hypothetical protein
MVVLPCILPARHKIKLKEASSSPSAMGCIQSTPVEANAAAHHAPKESKPASGKRPVVYNKELYPK